MPLHTSVIQFTAPLEFDVELSVLDGRQKLRIGVNSLRALQAIKVEVDAAITDRLRHLEHLGIVEPDLVQMLTTKPEGEPI